jgi:hypothetical protein
MAMTEAARNAETNRLYAERDRIINQAAAQGRLTNASEDAEIARLDRLRGDLSDGTFDEAAASEAILSGEELDARDRKTGEELDAQDRERDGTRTGEELDQQDREAAGTLTGEELDAQDRARDALIDAINAPRSGPSVDNTSPDDGTRASTDATTSGTDSGSGNADGSGTGTGTDGGDGDGSPGAAAAADGGDDNPHGGQHFAPPAGGLTTQPPHRDGVPVPHGGAEGPHGGSPQGAAADDPDGPDGGVPGHVVSRSAGGTLAARLAAADLRPPAGPHSDPRVTDPVEGIEEQG